MGEDLLKRPRLSRIYYRGKFFSYPLRPLNAVTNLGVFMSAAVFASYLRAQLRPIRPEVSFEDWVTNRFGRKLFLTFFQSYTEKVWGIPCATIEASWAAQRIQGLSLWTAIVGMFKTTGIKTLINEFEYPRLGPGMMWERCQVRVERAGGRVRFGRRVTGFSLDGDRVSGVTVSGADGRTETVPASCVISTMPVRSLVRGLPDTPPVVREAADRLKYRDFITVALVIDRRDVFPDNWIYIHDADVRVGRVQNFKNWSPEMVPDDRYTCLGLEYFCSEGDDLWGMSDASLVETARREIVQIGLARADEIVDGTVVRARKAYPVYDSGYAAALDIVKGHLSRYENLFLVGRNGMHKYNNQDHSMLTAMLAVRNIFGAQHDLWAVNADAAYHEDAATESDEAAYGRQLAATEPRVPRAVSAEAEQT
jgi:protoporphyrinogen oxidase